MNEAILRKPSQTPEQAGDQGEKEGNNGDVDRDPQAIAHEQKDPPEGVRATDHQGHNRQQG